MRHESARDSLADEGLARSTLRRLVNLAIGALGLNPLELKDFLSSLTVKQALQRRQPLVRYPHPRDVPTSIS